MIRYQHKGQDAHGLPIEGLTEYAHERSVIGGLLKER
jgi:hypothetical protein